MRSARNGVLTLGFLALAACNRDGVGAQTLSREAGRADLQALDSIVRTHSAYRLVNGYPFGAHLDSVGRALPTSINVRDFWRSVQAAVGQLQDGHSNVRLPDGMPLPASAELPFALTSAGDTVVALDACRCKLLAA